MNKQKKLCVLEDAEKILFDQMTEDIIQSGTMLKAALKHLKDEERQIIALYVIEGFKHREIAKIMNLPLEQLLGYIVQR